MPATNLPNHPETDAKQPAKRYVAFSGGADSTALALLLWERGEDFELVFSDTGAELPETYWTIPRVARYLGKPLHVVSNGTYFQWCNAYHMALPGKVGRWCTRVLKQVPQEAYFSTVNADVVSIGIRADEPHRMEDSKLPYPYDRPLLDAGMDKKDVIQLCEKHGLLNPAYAWRSNVSCFCCQFQRKNDWLGLYRNHPDLYGLAEEWERLSKEMREENGFRFYPFGNGFTLEQLRQADEAQLALWDEPREEACSEADANYQRPPIEPAGYHTCKCGKVVLRPWHTGCWKCNRGNPIFWGVTEGTKRPEVLTRMAAHTWDEPPIEPDCDDCPDINHPPITTANKLWEREVDGAMQRPPIEPAGDKAEMYANLCKSIGVGRKGNDPCPILDGGECAFMEEVKAQLRARDTTIATLTRRLELADEALEAGITVMEALADIVDAATKDKEISRNLQGLAWMVDRSDRAVTVWRDKLKAYLEGGQG